MTDRDKAAFVLQICASTDRAWITDVCRELGFSMEIEILARNTFNNVHSMYSRAHYAEAESRLRSGR